MIKNIPFTGFSAQPSDYDCNDGALESSLNIISENGSLHPATLPDANFQLATGHRLALIHAVPVGLNYIFVVSDPDNPDNPQFSIAWLSKDNNPIFSHDAEIIPTPEPLSGFRDITVIGNSIAVASDSGVCYFLWKDSAYKCLGNRPDFIPISFGAFKVGDLNDSNSTIYTDVPKWTFEQYNSNKDGSSTGHTSLGKTSDDDVFWTHISDQAFGLLFSKIADRVSSQGYVYQPFFIRYAFRLYDGSYSWHSAPIQILLSPHRPEVRISFQAQESASLQVNMTLAVPYFGIAYQILAQSHNLADWQDIITGIDIFFSAPVYTYNQDKPIGLPVTRYQFYDGVFVSGNRGRVSSRGDGSDGAEGYSVFCGHYSEQTASGKYVDHFAAIDPADRSLVCNFEKNESFSDDIQFSSIFFKVASIDLESIKPMSLMAPLPLIKTNLSELTTLEHLPDDFNSHAHVFPNSLFAYNHRLILSDFSIAPPKPFPLCAAAQAASKPSDSGQEEIMPVDAAERIRVFSRVNGVLCVSETVTPRPKSALDPYLYPLSDSFPRFIYHPDPNAFKMEIIAVSGQAFSIPLKQHPQLNGAYWFGGLDVAPDGLTNDIDNTPRPGQAPVPNRIYISEVDNPFVFPAQYAVAIDCGKIFALSSAAKALSQGQFGQFPVYAFTDNGIWAMEVAPNGAISARQPISRDVCINPQSITQLDSSVIFASTRGVMLVSGSSVSCISDSLVADSPFSPLVLPGFSDLHQLLGHPETDSCLPAAPFLDFISQCRFIYDYTGQRIIAYAPGFSYAYIYSLKSKQWGMLSANIAYHINAYPDAIAVNPDGGVFSASAPLASPVKGLILTRPLKLDAPDVLKTIHKVFIRGAFRNGSVAVVLYGSRDLINWHLVRSAKSHQLQGFSGSPYKFFRIAALLNLAPDESVSLASIEFYHKFTNKLR